MKREDRMRAKSVTTATEHQSIRSLLHVGGLVTAARAWTPDELARLPRTTLAANFHCDGKSTPGERVCHAPRLVDVLNLAGPASAASYVRVGAGEYVVPLARDEIEEAILADTVNDQPLSIENGGPWRLILPGVRCFASVKWVDRLEVAADPGKNTGLESIRERNRARRKKTPA